MRVAVVGAGIIGTTTAYAVKTAFPGYQVHVYAEEFTPDTTGDGSAGLWSPYLVGDTPREKILVWAGVTHRWLEKFWKEGLSSETGVSLLPVYRVTSDPRGCSDCSWTKLVYGAHRLTPKELEKLNEEQLSNYKDGWMFVTYTGESVRLLPWLTDKFLAMGGAVRKRKVHSLHELIDDGYDLIINCSGLGARELADDNSVTPIRGQVARVAASWAMHGYLVDDEDSNYIIPNMESTILGGTHQEDNYDRVPRKEDSKFIYNGCYRMMPSLEKATVSKEWVGLRPGRPTVRLEAEALWSARGKEYTVIHNYGHGGSGVTLSWGCALEVVAIMRETRGFHSNL
ncbi:D-aspartate oxidase-like [Ptiloglossa arizonensis]|uniref:D-aspartate oxidase-like n=1 Tax=Ptiloglossa arizonensis TaxID=3350558 RepID=UPI003F9FCD99